MTFFPVHPGWYEDTPDTRFPGGVHYSLALDDTNPDDDPWEPDQIFTVFVNRNPVIGPPEIDIDDTYTIDVDYVFVGDDEDSVDARLKRLGY